MVQPTASPEGGGGKSSSTSPPPCWQLLLVQELCHASLADVLQLGLLHEGEKGSLNLVRGCCTQSMNLDVLLLDLEVACRTNFYVNAALSPLFLPLQKLLLQILGDTAEGVAHLHSVGIAHGCLRPTCVLLNHQPPNGLMAKVGGAGLFAASASGTKARLIGNNDRQQQSAAADDSGGGTSCADVPMARFYLAPEVLATMTAIGAGGRPTAVVLASAEADVFSFGVLMVQSSRCG